MSKIKGFIKSHDVLMNAMYFIARWILLFIGLFIPVNKKSIIFISLAGRNFDDSPKALYDEIRSRSFFDDWNLIWAFKAPNTINLPRGKKVKFGTIKYWITLLSTRIWIENGGIDLGINLNRKKNIIVRTWHGTVLKYAEGQEKSNAVLATYRKHLKIDDRSIRCIQTENELDICVKTFKATPESFMRCGLPRNDCLVKYNDAKRNEIKNRIGIPLDKKVILYMPTFRNYVRSNQHEYYIKPPMKLEKWEKLLSDQYVLLMRTHYMVAQSLNLKENGFAYDVCKYQPLPDLYAIADILITDYSSSIFDFSITEKPIRCFGYDYEEYLEKNGLVYDMPSILPCPIMRTEDEVIKSIVNIDYVGDCKKTKEFKSRFAEYFQGDASIKMVDEIERRIKS